MKYFLRSLLRFTLLAVAAGVGAFAIAAPLSTMDTPWSPLLAGITAGWILTKVRP